MYRPIVIPPMRTSNVRSNIVAPEFVNMKLYQDGYKVTVSLHISEAVFYKMNARGGNEYKPIFYRNRYYIYWERNFSYSTPFCKAFVDASIAMRHMKILIRAEKIALLQEEIDYLSEEGVI